MSIVAVSETPSSIGKVELSMKEIRRMQHEAAVGLHWPARQHLNVFGATRQADALLRRDDLQLHEQVGKIAHARRLVDDDAHRAFLGMGAKIDDRSSETLIEHAGHGDQQLAVKEASLAGARVATLHGREILLLAACAHRVMLRSPPRHDKRRKIVSDCPD